MTENELRQKVASVMLGWVGGARGGAEHREILALYNARRPLPRGYALGERDAYCAAAVSAAWLRAGCDVLGLVPIECSCGMMLRLAKGAGLWREEDGYLPEVGDAVMYDWQDSGAGDNLGAPDHIGLVTAVSPGSGYFTVAEGNMSGGRLGLRTLHLDGRYIRGFLCPDYAAIARELTAAGAAKLYQHPKFSYVTVAEVPRRTLRRADIAACAQPRETPASFYRRQADKPTILINAGFFDTKTAAPCFGLVDEGAERSGDWGYEGLGLPADDPAGLGFGKMGDRRWRDWIAGYPVLVRAGKACAITYAKEISGAAARMAMGYNDTTLYIVRVSAPGLTLKALAEVCAGLGCEYAINLDGGGSAQLLVKGVTDETAPARAVDSVLAVYLETGAAEALNPYPQPQPGTLLRERVARQPGAFWAQWALTRLGYDTGGVDGYFWGKTAAAVKAFQRARGLEADGIVGPLTAAALTQ